jgi:hypothetical protein
MTLFNSATITESKSMDLAQQHMRLARHEQEKRSGASLSPTRQMASKKARLSGCRVVARALAAEGLVVSESTIAHGAQ